MAGVEVCGKPTHWLAPGVWSIGEWLEGTGGGLLACLCQPGRIVWAYRREGTERGLWERWHPSHTQGLVLRKWVSVILHFCRIGGHLWAPRWGHKNSAPIQDQTQQTSSRRAVLHQIQSSADPAASVKRAWGKLMPTWGGSVGVLIMPRPRYRSPGQGSGEKRKERCADWAGRSDTKWRWSHYVRISQGIFKKNHWN